MPLTFARRGVMAAAAAVAVLLTLSSTRYGYHRDELYFRMLDPAWGYVDQPPLVPLIARLLGDHLVLLRLPATAAAAASVVLVALTARELGAQERTQTLVAWAYAGTTAALTFGHVLLTSALDLAFWPLICLLVIRAQLRNQPRLWLVAGALAGLATYNRLLVGALLFFIAVALATVGPRRWLRSRHVLGGAVLAALIAAPNLLYQARNGWPQLEMGAALSQHNGGEARVLMWVLLVVGVGPVLVPVWLVGLRHLWGRPELRWLPVVFALLVTFTLVSGAQPHYPIFLLPTLTAAGAAAIGTALMRRSWLVPIAINAAVGVLLSVPVLPAAVLGRTPIPAMNPVAADTVGWPAYVDQVRTVVDSTTSSDGTDPIVLTSNYGEAGALARFSDLTVYSGHNALWDQARPADTARTVVVVGGQLASAEALFASCEVVDRLDNGVGVDTEEQGQPVAVCRDPVAPWEQLWPRLRHLD